MAPILFAIGRNAGLIFWFAVANKKLHHPFLTGTCYFTFFFNIS